MVAKNSKRRRARITVGHTPDGKPIRKYASGYTKKEIAANIEELKKKYIKGETAIEREILFGEFLHRWFEMYVSSRGPGNKKKSSGTRAMYAGVVNAQLLPVFGDRQVRAITAYDLQEFLNDRSNYTLSTLKKIRLVIYHVFRDAKMQGIIDIDPSTNLKILAYADASTRRALTEAEREAVLKVGFNDPDGLFLLVLYYTGLRRGEALGLQWGDIDFQNKTLMVNRDIDYKDESVGELKSEASHRIVPLPDELIDVLRPIRGLPGIFVFQGPETGSWVPQSTYYRMWKRLMGEVYKADNSIAHKNTSLRTGIKKNAAGKPIEKKRFNISILTPHYFRHNYASMLYDAGIDAVTAKEWLGHADVLTTLRIYTHLSNKKKKVNAEKLRGVFGARSI